MRVLVIGETCVDITHFGVCERMCPEAPVPIFLPKEEKKVGGMAANVVSNIRNLRPTYQEIKLLTSKFTPIKRRFIDTASGHMLLRSDEQDFIPEPLELNDEIKDLIRKQDAIIISDYNKGFLSIPILTEISQIALGYGIPSFIDTKKGGGLWASSFNFIKINDKEFKENWAGWAFKSSALSSKIIKTMGGRGTEYNGKLFEVLPVNVVDPTGAGDTFLAALAVSYLETRSIEKSIDFAQECCRIVVQKLGTAVVYD